VEQARRLAGDDLIVTLCAMGALVGVYVAREGPARAEPLAVQVVDGMRRYFGDQHPFTLKAIHRLTRVYQLQGRHAKAAPLLAEVLVTARKVHDDDHPVVSTTLHLLGRSLLAEKKYAEAEPPLRECLQGLERERSGRLSRNGSRVLVQSLLGESLLGQHKYAAAEPHLLAGYKGPKESPEEQDPEASPTRGRLGIAALERIVQLDAWGQPERSDEWRKELAARARPANQP
jgi:hypothetical protein